jgi:hypothetical protein
MSAIVAGLGTILQSRTATGILKVTGGFTSV